MPAQAMIYPKPPLSSFCMLSVQYAPLSVISANVRLALRCRSMLSEKTRVLRALRGSPEKKSVSPRWDLSISGAIIKGPERNEHFRDTAGGRRLPPARCRREQARKGHRGIWLVGISKGQDGCIVATDRHTSTAGGAADAHLEGGRRAVWTGFSVLGWAVSTDSRRRRSGSCVPRRRQR